MLHRESKVEQIYKVHAIVQQDEKKDKVDKDQIVYLNKNITVKDY